MSVTNNSTATPQEIQSKTIEISGRLFQIAKVTDFCWLLTDLATGEAKQFSEAPAMWRYIGAIKAIVPDMGVPQLPATIKPVWPRDRQEINHARQRAYVQIRSARGHSIPTRGVIALPASTTPEPPKTAPAPTLTGAQQRVADQFLDNAKEYFDALCAMDNAPMTHREKRNLKWNMDCHFQNMSHKAFTYAQMVGMGM